MGGGIAGMEAAGQLLGLGYCPVIVERCSSLGGNVAHWHKLFPDLLPVDRFVRGLVEGCSGAELHLSAEIASVVPFAEGYSITLSDGAEIFASHIIIATGFELFAAERKEEYGYGIYDRVVTNGDLERWFGGDSSVSIDPAHLAAIGFVHCVGSRDEKVGNGQCSKVCCITAIKQAIEMKRLCPSAQIYCFYMDLRLFGRHFEDFYTVAQRDCGVRFIRGRVSEVSENIESRVVVKAEDTLAGRPIKVTLDLLVLMSGMSCNSYGVKTARQIGLPIDSDGFLQSRDNIGSVICSPRERVYYAGACTGAKSIPETLAEARAVALAIDLDIKHSYGL